MICTNFENMNKTTFHPSATIAARTLVRVNGGKVNKITIRAIHSFRSDLFSHASDAEHRSGFTGPSRIVCFHGVLRIRGLWSVHHGIVAVKEIGLHILYVIGQVRTLPSPRTGLILLQKADPHTSPCKILSLPAINPSGFNDRANNYRVTGINIRWNSLEITWDIKWWPKMYINLFKLNLRFNVPNYVSFSLSLSLF